MVPLAKTTDSLIEKEAEIVQGTLPKSERTAEPKNRNSRELVAMVRVTCFDAFRQVRGLDDGNRLL